MQETQQQCIRCGRILDISSFGANRHNIEVNGGYSKKCKECTNIAKRLWYAKKQDALKKEVTLREKQCAARHTKWVKKICPACHSKIMVKTKIGECYCSVCGVSLSVSGSLGGKPGMQIKRANTHGIRLTVIRG